MPMLRRTSVLLMSASLMVAGGATAAQAQSSQTSATSTSSKNKSMAKKMVNKRGWAATQFRCLVKLWERESGWNHRAGNRYSGAYGIPQALPAGKMASHGSDWRTNPRTQIAWGLSYIKKRYGTPCRAWGHFQSHHWY
ncbi:transglycosylase SLT domain-containing protein [Nonomuraea sp. NPDC049486]|uniref:aggregation-promoting factor C-terminal-like domain-containing protein n=1 Tax=Nonomuraea TaxID=83681 RepID=UPI0027E30D25|nr:MULTISPECIES: transglycosylase SLT domain-containing protein [Nonomuraea]